MFDDETAIEDTGLLARSGVTDDTGKPGTTERTVDGVATAAGGGLTATVVQDPPPVKVAAGICSESRGQLWLRNSRQSQTHLGR